MVHIFSLSILDRFLRKITSKHQFYHFYSFIDKKYKPNTNTFVYNIYAAKILLIVYSE